MQVLANLLETNKLIPQIDSEYDLFINAIEGVKRVDSGHSTGKVVIKCYKE